MQLEALRLDEALTGVARSQGVIEFAIGRTLARLFRGDRLLQVGCSRETDYARERLGISPSLAYAWAQLARGLEDRPLLRQAVAAGMVSCRKALAVMPLAVGDLEPAWTEAAMRLTLREIASAVRAAGKESVEERFEAEAIVLPMTPAQQERLDAALALARQTIGPEARRWQCMEAIAEEWLSSFGEWEGKAPAAPPREDSPRRAKILAKQLAAIEDALAAVREVGEDPSTDNALALDARARRLMAARRRFDEVFGALAAEARSKRVHETLGYSFEEYCEERLGLSAGTVRQRIWLERRMQDLPALREAVVSGRLTYSKALVVARHATPFDVEGRIEAAASTTCQQAEREGEAEEDRKNRGDHVRRLWAPKDAAQSVRDAIASAQAWSLGVRGVEIDAGEALAIVADHFVEVWTANRGSDERRWIDKLRREVLVRKGGLCSVPGCSRAARHVHHIVFRSHGGKDTKENEIGLCMPHHLHGIHMGYLEVTGRAGERLHWKLGTGDAVPLEEWITFGDDDVRRADAVAEHAYGAHTDGRWLMACG